MNSYGSERKDECIDFTIITSRNNDPLSNFGDDFQCKSEYPWCIIEVKKKREFLRKTSFRQNQFFYMVVIQKLISTINILDCYENDQKQLKI
ncbi:Uncharacterized protein FWK35_00028606 [Aphis craccivora]|uniref:Uncharacterized protein n=1 Tax=Aphis craccivora TaxID=307492 RepID=A0A6G0Z047_APHCR|nr:Uncharacterized protein FWK35_00028606 [Aphis craccivora]